MSAFSSNSNDFVVVINW